MPKPKPPQHALQPNHEPPAGTKAPRAWKLRLPRSRWLTLAGAAAAVVVVLLAVPYTRYGLIGQFIQKPATIDVVDSRTDKPISDVTVMVGHTNYKTDAKGQIKIVQLPVGSWPVTVNKRYYNLLSTSVMQPLFGANKTFTLTLVAIGNQITVKVVNKITGKALTKAEISALGTTAATDALGMTTIVLPVGRASVAGSVSLPGYNDQAVTIKNTETDASANTFGLVPAGKIFYLDKRTGTINVMSANLDGTNPQVVVAGTGKESDSDTVLLASRDWKYLALEAIRDSDKAKLYVINTSTGQMDVMDQGDASFTPVGWDGDYFIYRVDRNDHQVWQPKSAALKSYDAASGTLNTLYENQAEGAQFDYDTEVVANPAIIGSEVIFTTSWGANSIYNNRLIGKRISIRSISPTGSNLLLLKDFEQPQYAYSGINSRIYEPGEIAFTVDLGGNTSYYQLSDDKLTISSDITADTFNVSFYPTYLESPSGNQTLWYDQRDGKNTLFTGNASGDHPKTIASLSDFTPFGWYTDNYILLSQNKSELFIAPADLSSPPIKITDYHKPAVTFYGYGGGYGGQ